MRVPRSLLLIMAGWGVFSAIIVLYEVSSILFPLRIDPGHPRIVNGPTYDPFNSPLLFLDFIVAELLFPASLVYSAFAIGILAYHLDRQVFRNQRT